MKQPIRTFRAATMDEALNLVRRELGDEAVVLESKPIETRRLVPWPGIFQQVEVMAQISPRRAPGKSARDPIQIPVTGQRKLRTLAESKPVDVVPSTLLTPICEIPAETLDHAHASGQNLAQPLVRSAHRTPAENIGVGPTPPAELAGGGPTADPRQISALVEQQHWTSLQTIVSRLERQTRPAASSGVPREFYQHYINLIEAEVEDGIARELISKLRLNPSTETPNAANSMLTALVERKMRCAPPISPQPGRREIVMVVGPTGVGKTTSLAKLAGHFHLREGLRVGLITVDAYRVGAIEQLQSYADILQIRLRAASNPIELRIAIDELDDVDLILIDTAGRGPWDDSKLRQLNDLVQVSSADHILLVLSLSSSSSMLSRIADRFALVSPTSMILTKLDEVKGLGGLLSIARDVPLPVSYLATGQDVPEQIEPANPTRLARLILNHDQILHQVDPPLISG